VGKMYQALGLFDDRNNAGVNQKGHGGRSRNSRPGRRYLGWIWSAFWSVLTCGIKSAGLKD
jgi:hypothetical protein